jgi:UDP-N-acetylmuramate: L-alanyl-gamma-D-glutamyl-meso-diaminopimelate ligase
VDDIVRTIAAEHRPGDIVVLMSNGGFGGIHQKLLRALDAAEPATPLDTAQDAR